MNLTDRIESYWNERSHAFNDVRLKELSSHNAEAWQKLILQHLPEKKELRILDIGTGTGFFALLLTKAGHKVTGIDLSGKMIAHAEENARSFAPTASFFKMDAETLAFEDEVFDAVISRNLTWTLPHVAKAYAEWHRVLKDGGILLNFDADYGTTPFTKTETPACVHSGIGNDLLNECTAIKSKLPVSSKARPQWDVQLLMSIGFSDVQVEPNICPLVHRDTDLQYDDIPVFGLYAKK